MRCCRAAGPRQAGCASSSRIRPLACRGTPLNQCPADDRIVERGQVAGGIAWQALFGGAHEQVVERHEDLDHDQRHDDHFKPYAALGVNDVTERAGGFVDDRELAGESDCALLELVFIGEPGVQPVELRGDPTGCQASPRSRAAPTCGDGPGPGRSFSVSRADPRASGRCGPASPQTARPPR